MVANDWAMRFALVLILWRVTICWMDQFREGTHDKLRRTMDLRCLLVWFLLLWVRVGFFQSR